MEKMRELTGRVECGPPDMQIYTFSGVMKTGSRQIPLDASNLVLRGMSLKNTEYIYGLVVYTGHETKVMKNSEQAKYKMSRLERNTSKIIVVVLLT